MPLIVHSISFVHRSGWLRPGIGMVALIGCFAQGPSSHAMVANEKTEAAAPDWPEANLSAKPWTRWWWPGSGVDEANLTRQLEAFAAAGLGGVEITPIYGARGYEDRYVDYLSPRWMELLEHAAREARRLGLGVDMATGTGWPFGGPSIGGSEAAKQLALRGGEMVLEPTGQRVKRAAPGGEGLVVDPFSPAALQHYLKRFDAAFADFPKELLRSQFHDSFEYYGANGTAELWDRFESLHGYRLEEWASALLGDGTGIESGHLARLKSDYRNALDQLHRDYLRKWADWAHSKGWKIRNQSHGAPGNLLDLYAIADIPETEVFGSTPFPIPGLRRDPKAIRHNLDLPEPLVSRMASSAAHVMGKPLVSCETATWLREHWKVALSFVKPELDRVMLDGINHVFYHGTVFSPAEAPWPGWLFYASTQFNPQNPWWRDFAALNAYVTRVQSILQHGEPDNDVLLYWPVHDIWHDSEGLEKQLTVHHVGFVTDTPFGALAGRLKDAGYAFDYISDTQIQRSRAGEAGIATPGNSYAALVVPPVRFMPIETVRTLQRLAREGAMILFAASPQDVPGMARLEERRGELQSILADMSEADQGEAPRWGDPLAHLRTMADVKREPLVETGLDFIRRRNGEGWDFFIANLSRHSVDGWVEIGVAAGSASLLDPLTGRGGQAALRVDGTGRPQVYLQLAPGESLVLRAYADDTAQGPAWIYLEATAPERVVQGEWKVTFVAGGPTLPSPFLTKKLSSWTANGDPERERFSGTARYDIQFELPKGVAEEWILDLGDLRESARVSINGSPPVTVWSIPFRMRAGDWLLPGKNHMSIEVTNTAANRIRDMDRRGADWKIMREINFVDINYRKFDASGWAVEPAGLLGPVTLTPQRVLNPGVDRAPEPMADGANF